MRKWIPILVLLVATGLLLLQMRRQSPARHVEDIAYRLRCGNCSIHFTMTTAEMNRMIDRGEVVSPPEQFRRFKCGGCGKIEATLDRYVYEHENTRPEEQP